MAINFFQAPSADGLLAEAYAEKRTIEMRIDGAGFVPIHRERSANQSRSLITGAALFKADAEIARRLQLNPEDVKWLHASGRSSMLKGDAEGAIISLLKAWRLSPGDRSIPIDVASAYFQRGQELNRPVDEGNAVDILGKVLADDPNNQVAQFNYAIAMEDIFLYGNAVVEWEKFLHLYPDSDWAGEARERLGHLQERIHQRQQRSLTPLEGPEAVADELERGQEEAVARIDARVEQYLVVAMTEWLPKAVAISTGSARLSQNEWRALRGLAQLLKKRHMDSWLEDMLRADLALPAVRKAVGLVAEADRLIQASDNDRAIKAARTAAFIFQNANMVAGKSYAQFQVVYANQLNHRNANCAAGARALFHAREIRSYSWLRIQAGMESAICARMSDERALIELNNILKAAEFCHYGILRSRAATAVSELSWIVGDPAKSWSTVKDGLRRYWAEDLPTLRGYNLLIEIDYLAEGSQERFLQAAVLKESLPMIADDPDFVMRAFEQGRLGQALLFTGDSGNADTSFREAQRLFAAAPDGTRKRSLFVEAEIGLAKVDIRRGSPKRAVSRLSDIRDRISKIPDDDLALDFFATYGLALKDAGNGNAAERELSSAQRLAEKGLDLVSNERDRLKWSRHNELTYRAMVELRLHTQPREALAYWEWYKSASLRGRDTRPKKPPDSGISDIPELPNTESILDEETAVVSFFASSEEIAVWVLDSHGTTREWISMPRQELEFLVRRFSEHCSQPESSLAALRREGTQLYQLLFLPIEPLIRGRRKLLIEPDGVLGQIPFVALVGLSGKYFGDEHAITISPGIGYVAAARFWMGITKNSQALVVANPVAPELSPLPDTEQEALAVAKILGTSRVLVREQATYSNIARDLPNAQIFHFAGHAVASAKAAGVVLGMSDLLDVFKLDDLRFPRTQLVVLAACSSAQGTTGLFDDDDSVARRFLSAGVPEVVASRWSVDSTATALLMARFYRHLASGEKVADALGDATRDVRSKSNYTHPYFWAGFSVFGRG